MLKNGLFWELLRILSLVILLCLNLDDVDGGLPRMGPRFSRPISSPTISKYPKRRPLAKKPKLPAEPPGFKSVADHPLSHYLPKDEVRKMLNDEASAEFKKIIDKTKINGHSNGKEINHFGNLHNGPNLPSPSTSNGFSRHPYDNEARRSPSTTPNRFNRPPATDQSNHPELFGGSHRDAAPVRVMDTNTNSNNRIEESAPAAARRNWETFDDEPEQRPATRNNRLRSIDEHDEMQMPSTSNDDTYHWEWLERNQPGNLERFKKFYKDATKINDKPTVKKDIGELAFSLFPQNDEQFSAMVYGGSRLPNALLGEDEDMREYLARRAAVRFGVRGVKEGINALLPAENAESIMEVAGPFAGAAAAPIISRSVGRGFKGYERYKKRGQLPWQRQENQKTLGIDKYLYDFEKGTLRKATDPKNLCPYVARCAIVGSGTLAGGTIGTAAGPPGMLVGGVIGNKVAERFVSAPVEEGIRRQFRRRRQFDYKKLRESLSLDDDEGAMSFPES